MGKLGLRGNTLVTGIKFLAHHILLTFRIAQLWGISDSKVCYTFSIRGTSVSVFSSIRSHATSERPTGATDTDDRGEHSSATRRAKKNPRTTSNGPWSRTAG